ncbi:oligoendopeptidase F [Lachnoclostridium phytofermentans]|uniref:Oligopeptidase F n=1 Tax=Lachnoclostridium phytofermentans (strain ATCC 700394 / DSM 18823 / ISDg) TaxID=357809 RepID=A9KJM6_LACP7|nr:oligoendopeptidase F [Lachnoclostridium phytofermentans]ABX44046.1 oligoendopeptidase F [Lachnoclostridium phytofermentans ISDg]
MAKELKKRSEVAKENTWAIEDIFASDELWYKNLEELKGYKEKILAFKGKLGSSSKTLLAFYQQVEELLRLLDDLLNYSSRKRDQDTKNSTYQAMDGAMMTAYVEVSEALSFETPEIITIPDEKMEEFYQEEKGLELYRRHIESQRRMKAHVLSDAEERLLAAAGEMSSAPGNINSTFNNADLVFPEITDEDGDKVRITHGNFIPFMTSKDRRVRKEAFDALYSVYEQYKNTSASILNAQVKQLQFFARAKKYNTAIEAALDVTEVPVSVYHSLIEAVNKNLPHLHRYMDIRKKVLGVEELHMYDLYTPIIEEADSKVSFEEAKKTILEALRPMGEDYIRVLEEGFNNRWIDVYENEGKRSGAYSAGARVHPYVLMNYADTIDSMFTLAHEMGHALHSYLSNHTQPTIYSDYVIFVAEVASTCNENLLMQYLLKNTTDKKKRAYLINHQLENYRTTLFRQTMFAEFELMINTKAEQGETLTADMLCEMYRGLNEKYYGKDVVIDDKIAVEWARIPHFYYNYYVFQYATGYSAAVALSNRILTEGESAVKDYLKFLSGGRSADPISLLKIAGIDMSTSKPVEEALKKLGNLLDEFESLI